MNLLFVKSVCWLMAVAAIQTQASFPGLDPLCEMRVYWQWIAFISGWNVHSASAPLTPLWNISALLPLFKKYFK